MMSPHGQARDCPTAPVHVDKPTSFANRILYIVLVSVGAHGRAPLRPRALHSQKRVAVLKGFVNTPYECASQEPCAMTQW